jgi:BirA family biotin operon repressor/biotin-[acetyl-CoA-carboxylase] ligase
MSDLSSATIEAALATRRLGHPVLYLSRAGSTNDVAHERAAGAAEGLLVVADEQTAGRGRLDRTWWAPPGASLLMSLLLRPPLSARQAGQLPMCLGLAAVAGIAQVAGVRAALKWPNDIVWAGRKLGGMLTELRLRGEQLDYVVLGLGVNVNLMFGPGGAAPAELWATAASLQMAAGRPVARVALLAAILQSCERWYDRLLAGEPVHEAWAAQLDTVGREVQVARPAGLLHGVATGVTPEGGLVVRTAMGQDEVVWAGDVNSVRSDSPDRRSLGLARDLMV